jgi:hypothetical protein
LGHIRKFNFSLPQALSERSLLIQRIDCDTVRTPRMPPFARIDLNFGILARS